MKCEKCGKNEATMYYKETVNGVTCVRNVHRRKTSAVRLKTHFSR